MFELIIYWQKPLFILKQSIFFGYLIKTNGKKKQPRAEKPLKKVAQKIYHFYGGRIGITDGAQVARTVSNVGWRVRA